MDHLEIITFGTIFVTSRKWCSYLILSKIRKGHIVMQKDFSKITVDFRSMEEGMSRLDLNGYVLSQPKEVLDDFIRRMEENPTMLGMIDRGDGTEDA